MAKSKVTNISGGPRGAYLDNELVMADKGETIEADDFNEEWFAKPGSKQAKDAADDDGFDDMTVDELEKLANDSGVLPEKGTGKDGAVLKDDIIAALRAA